ncbi:MAG: amino acid adenylation domain-containing protein [Prolixibacteraceae bacterium]|jgi:amino acid adenylation domain-containing protein|nr:amino acid adenylation domain-containing protein [Prolixibacteraceae bacterium]MBT6764933.1 amino acid adenylation domain-containing protein [Prolixibacteraceae bacterium]MBT6997413.1 amino acid adenylation domain-containing protein [Prolixibacteraceae bacterium]
MDSILLKDKPSCFLIGNTSLLIKCCDLLIEEKWIISGIISFDSSVINYAIKKNIPLKNKLESINSFLSSVQFDYLFSIVNEIILDKTILNLPLKLSVNYHDSLLPAGAGVFSTTWALIQEEKEHGISWHIIDEGIDTGDILIQKKIRIDKNESSISLNARCYQTAIESFPELLHRLQSETINPIKQDFIKRTYFSFNKRPTNLGILDFSDSEFHFEAFLNALDFGENIDNNFCTPKIFLANNYYIPIDYSFKNSQKNTKNGSIEKATLKEIDVKVAGKVLSIKGMTTIDGEIIELEKLIKEFNLRQGKVFPIPDSQDVTKLHFLYEKIIGKEAYWIQKLSNLNFVDFPFVNNEKSANEKYTTLKYELSVELLKYCKQINKAGTEINLFSLLLLYISRLLDNTEFDIWYKINSEYSNYPNMFSPFVPLGCKFEQKSSLVKNLELSNKYIRQTIDKNTFARDVYTRIKILRETEIKGLVKKIPFFIGQIQSLEEFEPVLEIGWGILISIKTSALYLVYNKSERNTTLAEKFFHHFSVFTQNIIKKANNIFCEVPLISELEKERKLFLWNQQKENYPENICIQELIEDWAEKIPKEIAIVQNEKKISYGELNQKANKIASYLIKEGIHRGDKIGVMMDRSINIIVSYIGILKTGAAYVPLDTNLPVSRLNYMIEVSEIKTIIVDGDKNRSFNNLNIGLFSDIINRPTIEFTAFPKYSSNDLAYIKFTSGSTGQPKGVMITQKNVVAFLFSYKPVVNLNEKRIGTCVAPLSFDTSVEEVYSCLCFGGTVHIMMTEQTLDLEYFAKYLVDKKINVSYIIPEFVQGIGKYLKNEDVVSLKTLITGLHPKKNKIFKPFFELKSKVLILNAYGPTEVTYGSSAYQVNGNENPLENTPIGKPFPNYNTYVADSNMQLLPDYIPGELLIGGIGLSRGYINKPEITKLKFVDFEYENFKTQVYKSGDVVYSVPSGNIHFVGRNDDQVKIKGYRIEISEIEEALKSNKNVETSIVIKRKGKKSHEQLIAYVKLQRKNNNATIQLRNFLQDKIPGYMIPSFIISLDLVPYFPNGKINYSLLPEPADYKKANNVNIKNPESATEEILKQIFEEYLDVEKISVEDNYFELGGDSLTAVHIMQKIEEIFGMKIPISMLYKYSSIRKLSNEITDQSINSKVSSIIPIKEQGSKDPVFFIHNMVGSVLGYKDIIKNIDNQYPVYGIQSNYNEDIIDENDGIEKLSAIYIKNILHLVKHKSVVLIGFSFGGVVAFEMARQLLKLGYKTRLIAVDTNMSFYYKKMFPIRYFSILIYNWLAWVIPYFIKSVSTSFKTKNHKPLLSSVNRILFEIQYFLIKRKAQMRELIQKEPLIENKNVSRKLARNYYPGIYSEKVFLIQCKGEVEGAILNKTKTNLFRRYVKGEILVEQVDTIHEEMLNEPFVDEITEKINSFLLIDTKS